MSFTQSENLNLVPKSGSSTFGVMLNACNGRNEDLFEMKVSEPDWVKGSCLPQEAEVK